MFRRGLACAVFAAALAAPGCAPKQAATVRTYAMGERIQLGNLIYNVFESRWLTQMGEGVGARVPESRFFLVRVSITNSGPNELIVPIMSVTDDSGKTYTELSNGDQVPQWIGYLRSIKPAESLQGNAVFDCSPRRYKMKLGDEGEQRAALVDIPLTFTAETPEIPVPELPEKK
jgi:hypothetical protein